MLLWNPGIAQKNKSDWSPGTVLLLCSLILLFPPTAHIAPFILKSNAFCHLLLFPNSQLPPVSLAPVLLSLRLKWQSSTCPMIVIGYWNPKCLHHHQFQIPPSTEDTDVQTATFLRSGNCFLSESKIWAKGIPSLSFITSHSHLKISIRFPSILRSWIKLTTTAL